MTIDFYNKKVYNIIYLKISFCCSTRRIYFGDIMTYQQVLLAFPLSWTDVLRKWLPFLWRHVLQARNELHRAQYEARIAEMNSIKSVEELVTKNFVSEKDGRLIARLLDIVRADEVVQDGLGSYAIRDNDPLSVHALFAGGKPHCWAGHYDFNLRHDDERGALENQLHRKVARSMVFHSTAVNPASIYKSTPSRFAAEDFEPELSLLRTFDAFEGHYSNG